MMEATANIQSVQRDLLTRGVNDVDKIATLLRLSNGTLGKAIELGSLKSLLEKQGAFDN
jgi:hypothetical protein